MTGEDYPNLDDDISSYMLFESIKNHLKLKNMSVRLSHIANQVVFYVCLSVCHMLNFAYFVFSSSVRSNRTHKNIDILKKFGLREPMFNSVRFDSIR